MLLELNLIRFDISINNLNNCFRDLFMFRKTNFSLSLSRSSVVLHERITFKDIFFLHCGKQETKRVLQLNIQWKKLFFDLLAGGFLLMFSSALCRRWINCVGGLNNLMFFFAFSTAKRVFPIQNYWMNGKEEKKIDFISKYLKIWFMHFKPQCSLDNEGAWNSFVVVFTLEVVSVHFELWFKLGKWKARKVVDWNFKNVWTLSSALRKITKRFGWIWVHKRKIVGKSLGQWKTFLF